MQKLKEPVNGDKKKSKDTKKRAKGKDDTRDETLCEDEKKTKGGRRPQKNDTNVFAVAPKSTSPAQPAQQQLAPQAQQSVAQPGQQAPTKQAKQVQDQPTQQAGTQTLPFVRKWVQRALDMGVVALREEYRKLAKYTMPEMTVEAFKANHEAGRNRYQDVPCQDQWRVVLKRGPVDYVHANYVSTPRDEKRFICTQGPLDGTVNEFWAMIVQEQTNCILMLCNCVECGKLKCAQYWPEKEGEQMTFESIGVIVKNTQVAPMPTEPSIRTTKLIVYFKDPDGVKTREVTHHQWLNWPDRGVPPTGLTSMELLSCVRGSKFPIVVHCSAGIGRTGTIVAIEYILERIFANEDCAAMNELLMKLRAQRAWSIQNDLQYLYVHRIMLCYFLEKHKERFGSILTPDNQAKYAKFVAEYDQVTMA